MGILGNALGLIDAIAEGQGESANRWGKRHGLAPLRWTGSATDPVLVGHPDAEHADADAVRITQQWADALGLVEQPQSHEGMREWSASWSGVLFGVTVEVWCVSDRAAFEAAGR